MYAIRSYYANEEEGVYQQAIGVLYAIAYTLKMSHKSDYKIEGFFEYVVPPLEGFWWQENIKGVDYTDKASFCWIVITSYSIHYTKLYEMKYLDRGAAFKLRIDRFDLAVHLRAHAVHAKVGMHRERKIEHGRTLGK